MVSSTYTDLKHHREALITAIHAHGLHPKVMEHDSAKLVDVIDSSLQMVRDSAAYILLISLKYGQTPESQERNPKKLSITELEFNEAQRLGRPTLLFIMGDDHDVKARDVEQDVEKKAKLDSFRERAKKSAPESSVHRVYAVFNSFAEFKDQMHPPLAELNRHLNFAASDTQKEVPPTTTSRDPIPAAPAFYAEPDYIGSHRFVGREAELQALSDWANRSDPTNLLLFEAIGGNGKSMLTWEWVTNPKHATTVRPDWAGRFWYSFYERGAIMQDFCQRALAYMTGRPLKEFKKRKTSKLKGELIAQLHARPWLLILDGLERVLVAYHRLDAAEVPDEEANAPTDKILNRNPCDSIRDEDDDLLRALAACAPSKILVSSRLTPRVLLNPAGHPILGAKRITLLGLRPPDAEALLRQCGISGDSAAIQDYLRQNCDSHPLVIGILAGLIANHLPDRGNFDAWSTDPSGGAALDLAQLDLIQRRNHILHAAIAALPDASRQLLSPLALLSESVDYVTLEAFSPHRIPEPEEVGASDKWYGHATWWMSEEEKAKIRRQQYETELARRKKYEKSLKAWRESSAVLDSRKKLVETVRDLEQRGLLQYHGGERRYDLHPVVRGVAAGRMKTEDRERYGQRVVDHFSSQSRELYRQAETIEDLRNGLQVVRTLLKLGRLLQASQFYHGDFARALKVNVEAFVEMLSLLRPFFPNGWGELPKESTYHRLYTRESLRDSPTEGVLHPHYMANDVATALSNCGHPHEALEAYAAVLRFNLSCKKPGEVRFTLRNMSRTLLLQNRLAKALSVNKQAITLAGLMDNETDRVRVQRSLRYNYAIIGNWAEVEAISQLLATNGQDETDGNGRSQDLYESAKSDFWRGVLTSNRLAATEHVIAQGHNHRWIRNLSRLRGQWLLEQTDSSSAVVSFAEALRMARESGILDAESETGLALAKFHLGQLTRDDAGSEAERLAQMRQPAHRYLAMLWLALGEFDQAKHHALASYTWACADGEPYVNRYELTKTTELLQQMNVPIPTLPRYDPAKDEPFPWEADVRAAIEKLRAEKNEAAKQEPS